ncbi:unnamed protein product [Spirodela intermedia]|uniref:Uncharacterized protein n=2 Tax=Spirodela intermedia TaxID=51605 RepID=A0A7I8LIJ8_SPIIN|nr:unnamed protein product [Spirodela intermedia]CAA6672419.1 unnamed protein product [Spirodela intermedia]CAA7409610.1 unnamed protein product [Spirodela intermedia]
MEVAGPSATSSADAADKVELQASVKALVADVCLLKLPFQEHKRAAASWAKVPQPKVFACARNAKEFENFLWDLDHYLWVIHSPDAEKVTLANMYLVNDANLWWRMSTEDLARHTIKTWEETYYRISFFRVRIEVF